jgi:hypothetical protein
MLIITGLSLILFRRFHFDIFQQRSPGRNLKARKPVPVGVFTGKYKKQRRTKVESHQAVNEQWVMFVIAAPTSRSGNFPQVFAERALIHVSEMTG